MLLSIITINYNDLAGLKKTMASVLEQSYAEIEYIVIDGGSTDGSKDYIENSQLDLAYWVSEPDQGIYHAMNKGINQASGDYLLFLNSGDWLVGIDVLSDVSLRIKDGKDIYYGDLFIINEEKTVERLYPDSLSFNYFFDKGHLPHPSMFIKKGLFTTVYNYNENFKIIADWDFYVCAICKYNATYKHLNLFITNHDAYGISNLPESRAIVLQERQNSLKTNFPLFIVDAEELIVAKKKLQSKRYLKFEYLDTKRFSRKINTVYLMVLSKVFGIKI